MFPAEHATNAVETAVSRGRNRLLAQLGLRDAALAAAIALAGVALLLVLGLDFFPPYLAALVAAAGVAFALWRWRRSRPDRYRIAQTLDARWDAADQISTAYHFQHFPEGAGPAGELQRERAGRAADAGDLERALPYRIPVAALWAAGLLLTSVLALGLRLSVQPALSLREPLVPMLFPSIAANGGERAEAVQGEEPAAGEEPGEPALTASARDAIEAERRPPANRSPEKDASPSGEDPRAEDSEAFQMPEVEGLSIESEAGDDLAFESKSRSQEGGKNDGESSPDGSSPAEEGARAEAERTGENEEDPAGQWSEESSSLLERLKEAFRKMMDSLEIDPPETAQDGGQKNAESGEGSQEAGDQASADSGAPGEDPGGAEMEGGEAGTDSPQQTAQGQGSGDSGEAGGEGESASASGSADGSKELAQQAAREAAMDALEEFFMQRAEEMSGEILVETTAARQAAQTPYRDAGPSRADDGGAVSRDEIPLVYQRYIEAYFQKLRAKDTR